MKDIVILHRVKVFLNTNGWKKEIDLVEVTESEKVYRRIDNKMIKKEKMNVLQTYIEGVDVYGRYSYCSPEDSDVLMEYAVDSIIKEVQYKRNRINNVWIHTQFDPLNPANVPVKINPYNPEYYS